MHRSRAWIPLRVLAIAAGLLFAVFTGPGARAEPPGPEVCQNCHADYVASYLTTKHGQKGNERGPANHGGCAACHGDGTEHVKAGGGRGVGGIINPRSKALSADERSQICLTCHADNRHLAFWDSGRHKKNDVTCSDCHTLHEGRRTNLRQDNPSITPYETTQRQLQYETCTACHKQIRAQILKPSHHPLIEGKLDCTSCHNPHGALSPMMVNNESINQLCTTCHADKRGPYMNEHPPVEENCLTCHTPHGSIHGKLLTERVPNLCEDCHDGSRHPGTYYSGNQGFSNPYSGTSGGPNNRLVARACLNCHTNIHGNNAPAMRGQFFLR